MSIRKKFIGATAGLSPLLPLGLLAGITGQRFIMPFYHIVSNNPCPHIKHLYKVKTEKEFIADIDYLATNYTPISATNLPDVINGKYHGKKIMLLSFDDGLHEMHEIVAPILLAKGIPAMFFLNTDFIDNKALMFRYQASLAIERIPGIDKAKVLAARSHQQLKAIVGEKLDEISAQFLHEYKPYMTTPQIQNLIDKGFTIGGHSCSHPYYADLSIEAQLNETLTSVEILQQQFNLKQKLFAFPFTDDGVSTAFFNQVFDTHQLDFTFGGAGIKNDIHPHQIQRIPMEGWDAGAEQVLKSEYLYYIMRMPLLKNKIARP